MTSCSCGRIYLLTFGKKFSVLTDTSIITLRKYNALDTEIVLLVPVLPIIFARKLPIFKMVQTLLSHSNIFCNQVFKIHLGVSWQPLHILVFFTICVLWDVPDDFRQGKRKCTFLYYEPSLILHSPLPQLEAYQTDQISCSSHPCALSKSASPNNSVDCEHHQGISNSKRANIEIGRWMKTIEFHCS